MDLIKLNGTLIRQIAQDGVYAEINPMDSNMILLTRTNGMVDIVDSFGAILRNITNDATMARFNGTELAVTKRNGTIEIRSILGVMLRMV